MIDTEFFSYGAGLVLLGWVVGQVFGVILMVINRGSRF